MIYIILLVFMGSLWVAKRKLSFIDVYPLVLVFFDISVRFAGSNYIAYNYLQRFLTLSFIALYLVRNWPSMTKLSTKTLYVTIAFLFLVLISPFLRGESVVSTLKNFSVVAPSMLVFPVAYHYYSTRGKLKNLLQVACYTSVVLVAAIIVFSILRIDVAFREDAHLGSAAFGMWILYYGQLGQRGALTYIWILILLYPLIIREVKGGVKVLYVVSILIMTAVMFISLKRATLVIVMLGIMHLFLRSRISFKIQILSISITAVTAFFLLSFTPFAGIVIDSYYKRGAERKFGIENVQQDVRFYEPLYVIDSALDGGIRGLLLGSQSSTVMDIQSDTHYILDRKVHNQYGMYVLYYGVIGLFMYVYLLYIIYSKGMRSCAALSGTGFVDRIAEVSFQNLTILFALEGLTGQHELMTYRSLVFLLAGCLSGHFYCANNKRKHAN